MKINNFKLKIIQEDTDSDYYRLLIDIFTDIEEFRYTKYIHHDDLNSYFDIIFDHAKRELKELMLEKNNQKEEKI